MAFGTSTSTGGTSNKPDVELGPAATDTISDLAFSPTSDLLAATSWDHQVRVWEANQATGQAIPKTAYPHDQPAFCCAFSKDGTKLASAGADKHIRAMDMTSGQTMQIPNAHEQPIKGLKWVDQNIIATGSWDKTLKYWDIRAQGPVGIVTLPERCYAMDISHPLMVIGTAERHMCILNLQDPMRIFLQKESPLKWQTRTVSCFPNGQGYAVGTIEGRVGIQYVDDSQSSSNFAFKCHRINNDIFAINCIAFHPQFHPTFATGGGDGTFYFWDKDSRQRLKQSSSLGQSITAMAFNRTGQLFAYASGYDWSKGFEYSNASNKTTLMLHQVVEDEVKPRSTTSSSFRPLGSSFRK